jgi:hypothetical protein
MSASRRLADTLSAKAFVAEFGLGGFFVNRWRNGFVGNAGRAEHPPAGRRLGGEDQHHGKPSHCLATFFPVTPAQAGVHEHNVCKV